ncbi:DVU0772 family protein [Desulfovibrio sp. UCD-KL4C]|uniref:DVU0772 family protein n=1 Tax=Desulfovibrio sp. UCD-KL4C TaxID=2578120 RepID=UPI0025C346BE|nr:hypothetical protein [Desulfovibrio sp. UCD-KL4C]
MGSLREYRNWDIDWEMTPEDAVMLYLEWGNHPWDSKFTPVTSKNDYTNYFTVYMWDDRPRVLFVRRNSEEARELLSIDLPKDIAERFRKSVSGLKGNYPINEEVREWIENQMNN